ncbi:MAG: 2,3,4,5-tetrahydropyridine-2,6-dicarboxylate N-succinyltransferase [Deltaproteobacteria bacterium]|nr:2,3,4,5-tetrahydropyridine-2,6-dicarboxylate N-succinyltransferase [Deltaproteobacteria bacterium]
MKQLQEEIIKIQRDIEAGQTAFSALQKQSITETIRGLDNGTIRVASKDTEGQWIIHEWVKYAILQYFRIAPMTQMEAGPFQYHDKIPLKTNYKELNVRVVPPATARMGSFMEAGVVLMPSYTNIGAWIGAGSMIDTWATVGSCAQIGAGVHISGGVGIGGVLEPASASPVIIEDGAFIGSRCILVEGVHIGQDAVLAANVALTASTPIIDIRGSQFTESRGKIPPGTVVIPGTREKNVTGGKIHTSCVYIIGERKESTDRKTSLNQTLREFSLSV